MIRTAITTALCGFTLLTMAQVTPAAPPPSLVTTTGVGTVYAQPDEVHFTIEINTEGEDLVQAKTQNAELASKALAYLKQQGVEDKYVQTAYLSVNVQYRDRARLDPRYFANQSIQVCLTDVDAYETVSLGLLERGITGLRGPRFASTKSDALRAEARVAAVKDARERALALAKALGQDIGKAYSITNVVAPHGPTIGYARAADMAMESAAAPGGPGVATGQLEITERVTAAFHLR